MDVPLKVQYRSKHKAYIRKPAKSHDSCINTFHDEVIFDDLLTREKQGNSGKQPGSSIKREPKQKYYFNDFLF